MNSSLLCPLCLSSKTVFFYADTKNHQHHLCVNCDLVFVAPDCRLDKVAEKARYNMHNNDYSAPYITFLSRLAEPLLSHLPPHAKGLDFGSGVSQAMANLFREQGHQCSCYDIYYYPNENLLTERYDFIIASEVIGHLYNPNTVF